MSQPQLNQRLTSTDASFLYFERKEAPLHIGGISVFEAEIPFNEFVAQVVARLPQLPRYRQKVTPVPFNFGHPSWEFDHNFDIKRHIFRVEVPAPGGEKELTALAGRLLSGMLSRDKPLWELHIVYGLENGRSAMISKVHHAMVDGISGVDLLKIITDISPNPAPAPQVEVELEPAPPQSDATRRFVDGLLASTEERMKSWIDFQSNLLNMVQTFNKLPPRNTAQTLNMLPSMATPVNLLPFNRPSSGEQKLAWSVYSFAEARAIRAKIGGTVNDVVLTVLSGAIARYVEFHGQNTVGRTLRVMVPVSMRREDQRGALGNLVSVLPVEIPLDIKDPLARYSFLTKRTGELKGAHLAEGINVLTALMGTVPASVQAFMGSLASSPVPPFNTVCTNVPGPQIPLYVLGKRMVASYPYVPIGFALGLGCAILSYDQKLYFGLTADAQAMPDVERLKEFLDVGFAELRTAAGVVPLDLPEVKPPAKMRRKAKSQGAAPIS